MPEFRAFYSVIQYMPDGSRAEAANAGVLLFVPSRRWLEVRVSPSLNRVRRFFSPGRQELRRIESALEALQYRMDLAREEFASEEDLARFVAARADAVRLTPPRLALVENPSAEIESLYAELVGDREPDRQPAGSRLRLPRRVAEVFGRLEAQHKVWRPDAITVPTVNRKFDVDFAYENGRVNYVKPESLADTGRLDARMMKLGFNGQLIYQHPVDEKPSQLVVLSADPQADPEAEARFRRTLDDFNVRFVPFAQAEAFATEVESTAH